MSWLTVEEIKKQCRIPADNTAEDDLIATYGNAAQSSVLNNLRRTEDEVAELWPELPADIRVATLMMAEHLYNHRSPTEGQQQIPVPYTVDFLLKPYIKLSNSDSDGI